MSDENECMFCGDPAPGTVRTDGLHVWRDLHAPHELGCQDPMCTCDLRACDLCCPTCTEGQRFVTACRSCGARIVFMVTTEGKSIPIEAEDMGGWDAPTTFEDGNLVRTERRVEDRLGGMVPEVRYVEPGEGRWKTHLATCKDADEWRKSAMIPRDKLTFSNQDPFGGGEPVMVTGVAGWNTPWIDPDDPFFGTDFNETVAPRLSEGVARVQLVYYQTIGEAWNRATAAARVLRHGQTGDDCW